MKKPIYYEHREVKWSNAESKTYFPISFCYEDESDCEDEYEDEFDIDNTTCSSTKKASDDNGNCSVENNYNAHEPSPVATYEDKSDFEFFYEENSVQKHDTIRKVFNFVLYF